PPPRRAAIGSVTSHASSISLTVRHSTDFASRERPIPMIAPEEMWVVETGRAASEAAPTRRVVTRLPQNPSAGDIGVTLFARVSVPRNPAAGLPAPMAAATAA